MQFQKVLTPMFSTQHLLAEEAAAAKESFQLSLLETKLLWLTSLAQQRLGLETKKDKRSRSKNVAKFRAALDFLSFQLNLAHGRRAVVLYLPLKVSSFQNVFLVSSFGQKTNVKISRISVLQRLKQKSWKFFRWFFVQTMTPRRHFEIN